MNIVLISYEFPPITAAGGIGSYMYHLSVFLTCKGHKVTVFSANTVDTELIICEQNYCTNYQVPAQSNEIFRVSVVAVFEQYLQSNTVDIIESPEVGACALYIKEKFPGIPLFVKMHTPGVLITKISNTYLPVAKKIRFVAGALKRGKLDAGYWAKYDKNKDTDLEYQICMKADILLSPSMALKNWASEFWGIPSKRVQLLPNPFSIQDELFSLNLQNRPSVISFVGKLSVLKGMKALAKAIPVILEKNKGYKIYLVGRDVVENGQSMQAYMQQELAAYESRIVFTGALKREALKEIYASSKICVFPSLWENYPNVIMEAMAAGAAVAASAVGGIPEIINHPSLGILFDPKNANQIAAAVNKLLQDNTARLAMAAAARKNLLQKIKDVGFEQNILRLYCQFEKTTG